MKEPIRRYRKVTVQQVSVFDSDDKYNREQEEIIFEQKFDQHDLNMRELALFLNKQMEEKEFWCDQCKSKSFNIHLDTACIKL